MAYDQLHFTAPFTDHFSLDDIYVHVQNIWYENKAHWNYSNSTYVMKGTIHGQINAGINYHMYFKSPSQYWLLTVSWSLPAVEMIKT